MSANSFSLSRPCGIKSWMTSHPLVVIGALLVLCLGPFANKAIHMDDPLFVWSAAWIQRHPGDFFGFVVNWFGVETPMTEANYNPPTTSYCLALAASLLGWQEIALHGAFLLAAFAAAVGIYHLAKANNDLGPRLFIIHSLAGSVSQPAGRGKRQVPLA
jgi:hypothetical protein